METLDTGLNFTHIIDTESSLRAIATLPHKEGEVVYCEELNQVYVWNGKDWQQMVLNSDKNKGIQMSLYEINQQIINQLPNLTEKEIEKLISIINMFHKQKEARYYMLLCSERSYFTLFVEKDTFFDNQNDTLGDMVIECMKNVGILKSFEVNEEDIEIWFSDEKSTECMHLFPYDDGIVEFRRKI